MIAVGNLVSAVPRGSFWALALVAIPVLGPPAAGQATGGSQAGINVGQGTVASGGSSRTLAQKLEASLGQAVSGPSASSESFELQTGVAWLEPAAGTDRPMVFGTRRGLGAKEGGEIVQVFGFNFTAPGAGAAELLFDGSSASGTLVASNTTITATTPGGTNASGNPLGAVAVEVKNGLGSYSMPAAHVYGPALLRASHAQEAQALALRLLSAPGSSSLLLLGAGQGPALPFPPFDGALELALPVVVLLGPASTDAGQELFVFELPAEPGLAGAVLPLQALSITDLLSPQGSFTNRLAVTVLP